VVKWEIVVSEKIGSRRHLCAKTFKLLHAYKLTLKRNRRSQDARVGKK